MVGLSTFFNHLLLITQLKVLIFPKKKRIYIYEVCKLRVIVIEDRY